MTTNLPAFASRLASYLRFVTGDGYMFARVILASDPDNPSNNDHIIVGICVNGLELKFFHVEPSEVQSSPRPGWMLMLVETLYNDARVVGDEMSATAVLAMIGEHMFRDKLASAQECLAHDMRND